MRRFPFGVKTVSSCGDRVVADPFAEEGDLQDSNVGSQQNYIHIRIQQRNGRKTLTTLQGLPQRASPAAYALLAYSIGLCCANMSILRIVEYDLKKLLKAFKKVSAVRPANAADEGTDILATIIVGFCMQRHSS